MIIEQILGDKSKKPKKRTEILSKAIAEKEISVNDLITYATAAEDPAKATCIEALEYATVKDPHIANHAAFRFAIQCLSSKAPRVKWEAAKLIGNTAKLFEKDLDIAISKLLNNTTNSGTVVRWSAAYALGEIIKLKTKKNRDLIPAAEAIIDREEKNSIKKIYLAAIKFAIA